MVDVRYGFDGSLWTAERLLDDLRGQLREADDLGMEGDAGFYAALIDYIETHELAEDEDKAEAVA